MDVSTVVDSFTGIVVSVVTQLQGSVLRAMLKKLNVMMPGVAVKAAVEFLNAWRCLKQPAQLFKTFCVGGLGATWRIARGESLP